MKRTYVAGAIAVAAVFLGVIYFAGDSADESAAKVTASKEPGVRAEPAFPGVPSPSPGTKSTAAARPVPADPRLAALMVSPDNALIEFIADPEGRVIKEIDNDPNSAGYRKSLREYTYAGDKVIRLVSYRYLGDQVQVVKADVVYKPDGSVDQYNESTSYDYGKKGKDGG
jgi:hypothetical protein